MKVSPYRVVSVFIFGFDARKAKGSSAVSSRRWRRASKREHMATVSHKKTAWLCFEFRDLRLLL